MAHPGAARQQQRAGYGTAYEDDDDGVDQFSEEIDKLFGKDPEDTDHRICPIGCRHRKQPIQGTDADETWATRMVGGIDAISSTIVLMEEQVDQSEKKGVDTAGMNHGHHSVFLPCEHCGKHSVCSWEAYQRCIDRLGGGGAAGVMEIKMMKTWQEYYLHIALTGHIMTIPSFSLLMRGKEAASSKKVKQGGATAGKAKKAGGEAEPLPGGSGARKRHRESRAATFTGTDGEGTDGYTDLDMTDGAGEDEAAEDGVVGGINMVDLERALKRRHRAMA